MTSLPKVSVIIPTHNRAHYICEAIDSALAQTYQNVEIVVVDDGSTDDTRAVLKDYEDKIHYYYQENQGVSAALNFGIEMSSGQYLAFLDDDDIWFPKMLEVQVAYLEVHPDVGMVHADMLIMEEGSGDPRPRKRGLSRPIPSGYVFTELIQGNFIMGSTMVVRRSCLDKVGLFDPELRVAEDMDLWLRIAQRFPITYLNRSLGIRRLHGTNISRNPLFMQEWHLRVLKKVLRLNPGVIDEVDRDILHFVIAFKTAYMCFNQGSHKEARRYFAKAFRLRPFHWPSHRYYLACLLPPSWIIGLRHLKQSFAKATKRIAQ
jgi:glycosyltransferase involved in cell wall biosynthesis